MTRKLLLILLVLLVGSTVVAQDDEIVVSADGEVVLGFAASLSGDTAPFGIDILRGVEEDRPTYHPHAHT